MKASTKKDSYATQLDKDFCYEIFSKILPAERIIYNPEDKFGHCTTGATRSLIIAIQATSSEEIQKILELANKYHFCIYPVSTGRNWGYGTSLPVTEHNIILDLSLMNQILEFNAEMGWVRIQPTASHPCKIISSHY